MKRLILSFGGFAAAFALSLSTLSVVTARTRADGTYFENLECELGFTCPTSPTYCLPGSPGSECDGCDGTATEGTCVLPTGSSSIGCTTESDPTGCGFKTIGLCEAVGSRWRCVVNPTSIHCVRTYCNHGDTSCLIGK